MRRVVVTGMGAITPIGLSVDEFWNSVKENTVGIDNITRFDTTDYKVKLAAEVKDFDAKNYMDFKAAKRMEKFSQYAVAAAHEAMKDSGLDMAKEDAFRVGVSVGSGVGSLEAMESNHKKLLEKGPSRINPLLVPLMITNMAAGNVSIQLGLKGKNINVVTACATGTNSIGECLQVELKVLYLLLESVVLLRLQHFQHLQTLREPLSHLTKKEMALSWVKEQVWLYLKNWSML